MDIEIDVQQNAFLLMPQIGRIIKYSMQDSSLKEIVLNGKNRKYIKCSIDMAVDRRGDIYIIENKEGSIKKIDQKENQGNRSSSPALCFSLCTTYLYADNR